MFNSQVKLSWIHERGMGKEVGGIHLLEKIRDISFGNDVGI